MVKIEASAPLGDSTCERCGKPFIKRDGTAGRFCSRACYETPAPRPPDPAAVVEARDAAVLRYLERHDGVASQKELLAAIPIDDPAKTPEAKADALRQSLARLKFKQQIGRTGETYSLVGAGTSVAHS